MLSGSGAKVVEGMGLGGMVGVGMVVDLVVEGLLGVAWMETEVPGAAVASAEGGLGSAAVVAEKGMVVVVVAAVDVTAMEAVAARVGVAAGWVSAVVMEDQVGLLDDTTSPDRTSQMSRVFLCTHCDTGQTCRRQGCPMPTSRNNRSLGHSNSVSWCTLPTHCCTSFLAGVEGKCALA